MKIILTTDVPKLGNRDDVLDLKEGFAQNVLLSKGKAILATPQALAQLENKKKNLLKKKEEDNKLFISLIENIKNKKITILAKANEKGILFQSIKPKEIVSHIKESIGLSIDEDSIIIKDHIKNIGVHIVSIKKGDLIGKFEIIVNKQ